MPTGYFIKPLRPDQIDQAYPLIQLATADIGIAAWRNLANALIGSADTTGRHSETGIMALQTMVGHLLGLFCFAVGHDLRFGRTLEVTNVVALPPARADLIIDRMIEEMEHVARRLDCAAVRIEPLSRDATAQLRREALVRSLPPVERSPDHRCT